jgi:NAD(P)-dependent dehydrogenase (short-subunit alcohol dehydrogenase family)
MRTAIVTGASRGLGLALARALAERGWRVVIDARGGDALETARDELAGLTDVVAVTGDVGVDAHRRELVGAAGDPIDLVVNNASLLGPSPLPQVTDLAPAAFEEILRANVVGPLGVIQLALPHMREGGRIVNVTSDAAVEPYEGWGGYGSSKAALDHASRVLAAEEPELRVFSLDPGDMRTRMHQDAFPGEDISDRPAPETVVPAVLALLAGDRPSGRYVAGELITEAA